MIFFDKKAGRAEAWIDKLWVYDLRTNLHFTLKQSLIQRQDFDEFVECYKPGRLHKRTPAFSEDNPEGRWRSYDYDELLKPDKLSLDGRYIPNLTRQDGSALEGLLAGVGNEKDNLQA